MSNPTYLPRVTHQTRIGVITAPASESGTVQRHQVKLNAFETSDAVASLQHYGFQSSAPVGSLALISNLAGDNGNGTVIATGNAAFRTTTLVPGESRLHDNIGQEIRLTTVGTLLVVAKIHATISAAADVSLNTPVVKCSGNLTVAGAATGVFTTTEGKTITVKQGIITDITPP